MKKRNKDPFSSFDPEEFKKWMESQHEGDTEEAKSERKMSKKERPKKEAEKD